jgi:ABC-type transporter Mla MlaB component
LAALDFCVVYEVSPPPWEDPLCELVQQDITAAASSPDARHSFDDGFTGLYADLTHAPTVPMEMDAIPASVAELSGEVFGDAAEVLDKLQVGLKGASRLVISCDRLIRVDFSAAGSILNWVAIRESEGCHVQFRDVPRLVAAFFSVIGINEHARVVLRNR